MESLNAKSGAGGAGPPARGPEFTLSAPAIALPKGGGAIRGIGEKLAANLVTGWMSVPIATSPGRAGKQD